MKKTAFKKPLSLQRPLTIGFQGWFLTQSYTGIGQHGIGLLRELSRQAKKPKKGSPKIACIVPVPKPVHIQGITQNWIHVLPPKGRFFGFDFWPRALQKWYWERVQVPAFFAAHHASKQISWEYYPYPCPLPIHSIHLRAMTIHDLILWDDARYQGNFLKRLYHRFTRRALVHVDELFTVSRTTHDALGIPVAHELPNGALELPRSIQTLSYGDALVYLGGYDIRKKVPELVATFTLLLKKHKNQLPIRRLILIGEAPHRSRYYPSVPEAPEVIKMGVLPDEKVFALLKSAYAFIHFSDSEGFNIPLLTAMTLGTPAIVKDIPANREISAGSSLFLKEGTISSLSEGLFDTLKWLENPKHRNAVIAAQKKAAQRYSWKKSVNIFLKILHHRRSHGT